MGIKKGCLKRESNEGEKATMSGMLERCLIGVEAAEAAVCLIGWLDE